MMPKDEIMTIAQPLLVMFETNGGVECHIWPSKTCDSYQAYGLLVCDLVRHISKSFSVNEEQVWEWVERERAMPTTELITKFKSGD